jgi:hypothetical protein
MPKKNNEPSRIPECHPERKHLARGLCKPCYDKWLTSQDRPRHNARKRAWAKANPDKRLAIKRRYLYGAEEEVISKMLAKQSGLCVICGDKPATNLDHSHRTGSIRGILCGDCNRGLGLFRDSPQILLSASKYLQRADAQPELV